MHSYAKLTLALGVVLALVSCILMYRVIQSEQLKAQPVPMVSVLTAARPIDARTVITGDMLKLASVPATVKMPDALTEMQQAQGKVARIPMLTGEQVLADKLLVSPDQTGLSFSIPDGKRAVAVAVNEVVGSGGFIQPGDHVDVVAVMDTKQNSSPTILGPSPSAKPDSQTGDLVAVSQYILQDVEVLAVAQQTQPPDAATPSAPGKVQPTPDPANEHSVTLAVNAADVEKVVLAEDRGHIRLALRPHGDSGTVNVDGGLFGTLNGAATLKGGVDQ
ncbi:MAG: Flp pilus assembly protein CpaB [Chloroflexi bacterium]|nr:Flp pilus assembly protein CpaB [Chloroflexota bacterium]